MVFRLSAANCQRLDGGAARIFPPRQPEPKLFGSNIEDAVLRDLIKSEKSLEIQFVSIEESVYIDIHDNSDSILD